MRITLDQANRQINDSSAYVSDAEHYGKDDYWEDATDGKLDCEDYAITKLRLLLASGWLREAFKIGLCWTELNEYHAVLVATEDGEDFVLDNRYREVMRHEEVTTLKGYRWDKFYLLGERVWRKFGGQ